jgi:hypothetical protein
MQKLVLWGKHAPCHLTPEKKGCNSDPVVRIKGKANLICLGGWGRENLIRRENRDFLLSTDKS